MAETRERLQALLEKLGYHPEPQGDRGVRIVFDNVYATVIFYDDGTLSFLCSVKGEGMEIRLDDVNAANNRVKFAKFSVDRHSNLQLEADFVFPMAVTDVEEQLRNLLQLWRLALLELKALVQTLAPA